MQGKHRCPHLVDFVSAKFHLQNNRISHSCLTHLLMTVQMCSGKMGKCHLQSVWIIARLLFCIHCVSLSLGQSRLVALHASLSKIKHFQDISYMHFFHSLCYSRHSLGPVSIFTRGGDVHAPMTKKGSSLHSNHSSSLSSPIFPLFTSSVPCPSHDKVKMGCGIGCHSAWLSHRPHRMPFRVPQSNNCCVLLQREMGSERPLWMFLLNHAECVTIG